jgi:cyclopropane fatty-acyl-phospholipid synthase-like methyltransferase
LLERLGADCGSVLEPGCGSGRMLSALARRDLEVAGIDLSTEMVEIARRRASGATIVVGDMVDFDLGRTFGGAVCPIGTLMHLTPEELPRHLEAMGRHLRSRSRYLVQLGILDPDEPPRTSRWHAARGETKLQVEWALAEIDPNAMRQLQRSRIEVLSGPRAGEVIEEEHEMTAWTWQAWDEVIAASPFDQTAVYDGNEPDRPRVEHGTYGGLLWHELARTAT